MVFLKIQNLIFSVAGGKRDLGHRPTFQTRNTYNNFIKFAERDVVHCCSAKKITDKNNFDLVKVNETRAKETFKPDKMVVTAVFLGVIVAGLSVLDIYLLKQCFGEQQRHDDNEDGQVFPVTMPYFFAR